MILFESLRTHTDTLFSSFVYRVNDPVPRDYETPPFPSLYWPLPVRGHQAYYLYEPGDIWRFTLIWTLIFFGAVHVATSGYAVVVQWRNWKVIWIVPVIFCVIGGMEALIAGSIVGGLYVWYPSSFLQVLSD